MHLTYALNFFVMGSLISGFTHEEEVDKELQAVLTALALENGESESPLWLISCVASLRFA